MINIYVGNLAFSAGEEDLKGVFGEFGPVNKAQVIMDRDTGQSRGFAFVEMESREDGEKAIESLNGTEVLDREVVVNEARPKAPRGGGGGGGRREPRRDGESFEC